MAKETEFINPYNFIPQFKGVVRKQNNLNEGTLTGYIECELTTKTPMIIVDPNKMKEKNGHKTYSDTFRLGDGEKTPAIPASALRGMIRSKFETLTNSCMSNLDENLLFTGRYSGFMKKAGLLDCSGKEPILYATQAYPVKKDKRGNCDGFNTGDEVTFCTESVRGRGKEYIKKINDRDDDPKGIVKLGERMNENSVYVFQSNYNRKIAEGKWLKDTYENLNQLFKKNKDSAENHKGYTKKDVKPVWYVQIENQIYISLSQKGQIEFNKRLKDVMRDDSYLPCRTDEVCSACDLFGMVNGKAKSGKVRFSDALLTSENQNLFIKKSYTLPPLNTPKHSNASFYLQLDIGKMEDAWNVDFTGKPGNETYLNEGEVFIRGRKEYWHHQPDFRDGENKTNLNSTVDILNKGLKYAFKVYFDSITENELNQLLFSICLGNETDYCHKLGMGKPLGFGSIKVKITKTVLRDVNNEDGKIHYETKKYSPSWCDNQNGLDIISELYNLNDTQTKAINHMYSFNFIEEAKIVSYPKEKNEGDNGYEWFSENKDYRTGKYKSVLPFADKEYDDLIQHGHDKPYRKSNNKKRKSHASKNYNKYKR